MEDELRLVAVSSYGHRLFRRALARTSCVPSKKEPAVPDRCRAVRSPRVLQIHQFSLSRRVGAVFGLEHTIINLPLPLGVSFVTFTLTAYVVDIYRGKFPAKASPTTVAGYILFFPHLIAGPILRPVELIPQLEHPRPALSANFYAGLAIFTVGLVKKLVFADPIATVVDAAYATNGAEQRRLGTDGFRSTASRRTDLLRLQRLHGYGDWACAACSGFGCRTNFRQTLRGHVTRPIFGAAGTSPCRFGCAIIIYIPLGGAIVHGTAAHGAATMMITMALGGLWHGAKLDVSYSWGFAARRRRSPSCTFSGTSRSGSSFVSHPQMAGPADDVSHCHDIVGVFSRA